MTKYDLAIEILLAKQMIQDLISDRFGELLEHD